MFLTKEQDKVPGKELCVMETSDLLDNAVPNPGYKNAEQTGEKNR